MRCKTCDYPLEEMTDHRCPDCGRPFDPADPDTFDSRVPLYKAIPRWSRIPVWSIWPGATHHREA